MPVLSLRSKQSIYCAGDTIRVASLWRLSVISALLRRQPDAFARLVAYACFCAALKTGGSSIHCSFVTCSALLRRTQIRR